MIQYVHIDTKKQKPNIFTQKSGLFNDINNKESMSATKSTYKNSYNLHLSACPSRFECTLLKWALEAQKMLDIYWGLPQFPIL